MALRTLFLTLALLLLSPAPATADCVKLRGAADQFIDRSALCRNLRQELTAKKPDLGRAFRKSIRADPRRNKPSKKKRPSHKTSAQAPRPTSSAKPTSRPKPKAIIPSTPPPSPVAQTMTTDDDWPQGVIPTVVAVVLLLVAFAFHQVLTRPAPVPVLRLPPMHPEPTPPSPTALGTAEALAKPLGLGVTGPGANGFVRAVMVELLTRGAKVVIARNELNRLFEGDFDETLRQALPHLHITETLQDAVQHLELDQLMADAEEANPDLSPTRGRRATTYWITQPAPEAAALLRRNPALVGLLFGAWPPGLTCTIDPAGKITQVGDRATDLRPPALLPADALKILRAEGWF